MQSRPRAAERGVTLAGRPNVRLDRDLYRLGHIESYRKSYPLRRSLVPELVAKDDLPNAVVLCSTIVALSQLLGPALAGALITVVGFGWCFVLDAVTYLAVLACLVMMREGELYRQPPRARTGREVREGLRYLASVPRLGSASRCSR